MVSLQETIKSHYSLTVLEGLDPSKPDSMTQIITGMYLRTLTVDDISDGAEPIRYMGFNSVPSATGKLPKSPIEFGRRLLFQNGDLGRLAIMGQRHLFSEQDWYAIQVIGIPGQRSLEPQDQDPEAALTSLEPLVHIQIN